MLYMGTRHVVDYYPRRWPADFNDDAPTKMFVAQQAGDRIEAEDRNPPAFTIV